MNKKISIVLLACIVSVVSSLQFTFANQDMENMLHGWFDNKKSQAIERIEGALATEAEQEKLRLQSAISEKLQQANEDLVQHEQAETQRITHSLQQYTNELIASVTFSNEEEKQAYTRSLEEIMNKAIAEMNGVEPPATVEESVDEESNGDEEIEQGEEPAEEIGDIDENE